VANFVSRWQFTVEWRHCDPAGIVFNSRFFEFFDWGAWKLFEAALGVKPPDIAAAFGIMGLPLVDTGARFLAPARFGDAVRVWAVRDAADPSKIRSQPVPDHVMARFRLP
jgi:4-hydroxybenzoyl-CoA thioesterase